MGYKFNPFTGTLDDTGSGSNPTIGGSVVGGTNKSVLFIDSSQHLAQDPTNFNYNQSTKVLSVPTLDTSSSTLAIGTANATTINIGNSGSTINLQGTTIYENVTQLQVKDPLITLNKNGAAGSASNSGIELEENSIITGYVESSGDRNSWILKAPNTAGIATITPGAGGITLNQSSHDPVTFALIGSTPNANAASISGQQITLLPANGSNPGILTAGTQTIGGNKTFSGSISASNLSGTNTGDQTITLTSDITGSGSGSFATTISSGVVTNSKLSTMANNTVKGNVSGGSASPTDLTVTQLTALINPFVGDSGAGGVSGAVPAPSAGDGAAAKFLRADGTWANTTDTGVTSVGTFDSQVASGNGLSISGKIIYGQSASASNPGMVNTSGQTFAGNKTFSGTIGASNFSGSHSGTSSGTNTGDQTISLTSDVTGSGTGSFATTIAAGVVSNSKLANMVNNTIKGNKSGSTGAPSDLVLSDVAETGSSVLTITNGSKSVVASSNLTIQVTQATTSASGYLSSTDWNTFNNKQPAGSYALAAAGDISQTSFTAADNQSVAANVTGLAFANASVRSFDTLISIVRNNTYAVYKLVGVQRAADWAFNQTYVGDATGITFSITTAGQVQYTSTSTGFGATMKFRAITTSV